MTWQITAMAFLFSLIFATVWQIFKLFEEKKVIKESFKILNDRYESRKLNNENMRVLHGNMDKKSFMNTWDDLIERSSIKAKLPFLTSEIYLIIMVSSSITTFFISKLWTQIWIINLAAALLVVLIFYEIIYISSVITYERVDQYIILFLNMIENFSKIDNSITSIFEKTIPYLKGPLKRYISDFVKEVKETGNTRRAFEKLNNKIENDRFRMILTNLSIASRHEANYKEMVASGRFLLKGYFKNKKNRKSKRMKGTMGIFVIYISSWIVLTMMNKIIPNMAELLFNTSSGIIILLYCMVVILCSIKIILNFEKN